ncbi:MAG: hypothetical protein II739_07665 [Clostridia bacterium]|nr:hypothetical protein [Clostridia bacterium]
MSDVLEKKIFADGGFNLTEISYDASGPVKLDVEYAGGEKDVFYLEEGKNKTFRCLVPGYTEGVLKDGLEKLDALKPGYGGGDFDGEFTIREIRLKTINVYSDDTYYLENGSSLKVGIRLIWGGGINYIEDFKCPVPGLKNIINQADTGRLIQQSYYGTGETPENPDFKYGTFMGHDWVYNPVQGGDRGGLHSRLVDIDVREGSVYIKAQPKDWGKVGYDTPSYMENVYSLDGDMLRVDNRFVDFSGWKHGYRHQELPAFYTVSYLDRFTWYDGTEPWTGAPLTVRDDLNFWGLPEYADACTFRIRESDTETWCAWLSSADDYGIGLFVPGVDVLKAGRHMYNGSKDPDNGATNYVAPLNMILLESFRPVEYSYLITCGSVSEIRRKFTVNKDFCANDGITGRRRSMRIPDDAPKY